MIKSAHAIAVFLSLAASGFGNERVTVDSILRDFNDCPIRFVTSLPKVQLLLDLTDAQDKQVAELKEQLPKSIGATTVFDDFAGVEYSSLNTMAHDDLQATLRSVHKKVLTRDAQHLEQLRKIFYRGQMQTLKRLRFQYAGFAQKNWPRALRIAGIEVRDSTKLDEVIAAANSSVTKKMAAIRLAAYIQAAESVLQEDIANLAGAAFVFQPGN